MISNERIKTIEFGQWHHVSPHVLAPVVVPVPHRLLHAFQVLMCLYNSRRWRLWLSVMVWYGMMMVSIICWLKIIRTIQKLAGSGRGGIAHNIVPGQVFTDAIDNWVGGEASSWLLWRLIVVLRNGGVVWREAMRWQCCSVILVRCGCGTATTTSHEIVRDRNYITSHNSLMQQYVIFYHHKSTTAGSNNIINSQLSHMKSS